MCRLTNDNQDARLADVLLGKYEEFEKEHISLLDDRYMCD